MEWEVQCNQLKLMDDSLCPETIAIVIVRTNSKWCYQIPFQWRQKTFSSSFNHSVSLTYRYWLSSHGKIPAKLPLKRQTYIWKCCQTNWHDPWQKKSKKSHTYICKCCQTSYWSWQKKQIEAWTWKGKALQRKRSQNKERWVINVLLPSAFYYLVDSFMGFNIVCFLKSSLNDTLIICMWVSLCRAGKQAG